MLIIGNNSQAVAAADSAADGSDTAAEKWREEQLAAVHAAHSEIERLRLEGIAARASALFPPPVCSTAGRLSAPLSPSHTLSTAQSLPYWRHLSFSCLRIIPLRHPPPRTRMPSQVSLGIHAVHASVANRALGAPRLARGDLGVSSAAQRDETIRRLRDEVRPLVHACAHTLSTRSLAHSHDCTRASGDPEVGGCA